MRIKRTLFFSLILFLIIFSISFASADELTTTDNTNELSQLSVSNDISIDENINNVQLDSVENQNVNNIKSNSSEELSSSDKDLKDGALNTNEIESDECLEDNNNGKVPTLQANKLGLDINMTQGSAQDVMNNIVRISRSGGGTLYLNGGTYGGSGNITAGPNEIINITNVRIVGGNESNPNQFATFRPSWENATALTFNGYSINNRGNRYFNDSGVNLKNVSFEYLNCSERFFSFASGSLTDCVFDHLESYQHLFFLIGSYMNETALPVTNCNFTNSKQTCPGERPEGGTDGRGQFGVIFGAKLVGCNFINTSSATHGGAFCLSDEWETAACVASKVIDCNFINITSRWFAVYIHGNYTETLRAIKEPQVVENCNFINCTGTGEYGGALGISHNDVIVRNCNFTNNTGGEGSAIMVGGIKYHHDGFLGNNTEGNNITIDNCTFRDNVAKTEGQTNSTSPLLENKTTPTGYAGAVFVYGNHTNIINSTFDNNTAVDSCGAAIYIFGQNTTVIGSDFYNHNSANGTIYLVGNECKIRDSDFHDNNATSTGSCIFILGSRAEIGNSTFVNNTAPTGGCIFITGNNTIIGNDSTFISNNATDGAGVYIIGNHTNVTNSSFLSNIAENGAGIYLKGEDVDILQSYFEGNNASNGGATYIDGDISIFDGNKFLRNNVTNQGGAVYINGHNTTFSGNNFTENEAVPLSEDLDTGLGGAIFVHGDMTKTIANNFTHNKARNGSAIYTDGTNFNLTNDQFFENQAWSYNLVVTAEPEESLYGESDITINVTHRGGDNIINAIHNHYGDPNEVKFLNVTYWKSDGSTYNSGSDWVSPVVGAENSQGGTLLYQDDREDLQTIQIHVAHEDGQPIENVPYIVTDIYGKATITLTRDRYNLRKGFYLVDAEHVEDWNYKNIVNVTSFRIKDSLDLLTNKTSDEDEYFQDEIATWNITVKNAANGTDAENVTITDYLPDVFKITNLTYTFLNENGEWTNGTLDLATSTLRYGVYNSSNGEWVYANASYNASNNTWIYYFFELDNDMFTYTVFNADDFRYLFGDVVLSNSTDICYENISYNIPAEDWYYDTIKVGDENIRYGHFNESHFTQYFGQATWDSENKTWVFVNNTPDGPVYTYYNTTTGYWIINNTVYSPERKTLTQKVSLTIENQTTNNLTNVYLRLRDFDKNNTGILIMETNCTKSGNFTNIVNITTPDHDWDLTNNEANKTVDVVPLPEKNVTNSTPYYHDYVDYNLIVKNTGNETYQEILTVVDSLPEGLEYNNTVRIIGATQVGETLEEGQKITWQITNIPAYTNATITVRVKVNAMGNLTNNMTLIAPKGANRTVNETITPQAFTDISVNKTVNKEEYFLNETVIWTITVHNAGNGTNATNVTLRDILPSEVEFISANNRSYNSTSGEWNIGFLENGTSVTLVIRSRAAKVADNITNTANVRCNETEWNYTNNVDNATISIIPVPKKTANQTVVSYNEYVDYNLTIINVGDVDYTGNLTVIDNLPVGLAYNNTVDIQNARIVEGENVTNDNRTITWVVTDIPANTNAVIIVRVHVGDLGVFVNNYTLIGPKGSERTVNETISVDPNVDLSINKTADKEEYFVNETVTWTITVHNAWNGTAANNVTVYDVLPYEVEFIEANSSAYNNTNNTWFIGTMGNGTNATLVIKTRAVIPKTEVTNTAEVNCTEVEWDYTNNIDNATISIVPVPKKTVNNPTPFYHEYVYYNLTVINEGDTTFTDDLIVIDSLPDGLTFNRTERITGAHLVSERVDGQKITWVISDIRTSNATITVRVRADAIGELVNNYTLIAPKGSNRTVNATINVKPIVDVSVTKTVDKEECKINDTVVWTITVRNAANGTTATNVNLSDILPKEFEFLSYEVAADAYTSPGTYNSSTGIWNIGTMPNGTSVALKINSKAITTGYNITNIAEVNCSETEWDYTNNIDNASINVIPVPHKTVNESDPFYHEIVEYNLTVINNGTVTYTDNITVIDTLDEGLVFINTTGITGADVVEGQKVNGQNITWVITNIPAKGNATITVKVQANAIGLINNTQTIKTPKGTNMSVTVPINVKPIVDVSVTKTVDKEECKINDTVTWFITVTNAWNGTNATNVILKDILPKEFEFLSCDIITSPYATPGKYDNETGILKIDYMMNGTGVVLVINSKAITTGYNITNTAKVNCSETEWDYTNNIDNASINVIPVPHKTVNESDPFYHEIVEYNLTVINNGTMPYTDNITVIDTLDEGLVFINTTGITGADIVERQKVDGQNITWVITNIPAKGNATITVKVQANAIGLINNTQTIKTPKGTNMSVTVPINVKPIVDVSVTKTVDKEECKINDTVVWTITVRNAANGTTATNVTLKDILPKEFEFLSYQVAADAYSSPGTYNSSTGIWNIGTMLNGTSVVLEINSKAITTKYNVTNIANVSCNETEWDYTNNIDNATVSIIPVPHKTVNESNPFYHKIVEYNLTVINNGTMTYTDNITVIDTLGEGLVFINTTGITGADVVQNQTIIGQNITWVITNIPAKGNATITVKVQANAIGLINNTQTIRTPKGTTMIVDIPVIVNPIVDVSVTKTVDKEECKVNETATWTITVRNAANGTTATNVTLKDILPKEFIYVSSQATRGAYNNTTGTWYIGTMANGTSVTLTINSKASKSKYNVTNIANVSCNETEWDYTNNIDNASINIVPIPVKTVNTVDPFYHEIVEYNLTVINTGNMTYTDNITVIDSLEEGLVFINTTGIKGADVVEGQKVNGQVITWVITNITANGNATITVKVQANAIGVKFNNLTIKTPKGTNQTVNISVNVKPIVDVSVTKTVDKEECKVNETVTWTITVTNAANGTKATNVTLKDILPKEFEYVSNNGTYDNETGIWYIGDMENGTSVTITMYSTAKTPKYNITNIAEVNCSETEWDYTNNIDNASVNIIPIPVKTVDDPEPYYHKIVEYNLTIMNYGDAVYTDYITVNDTLDEGLLFINTTGIKGADVVEGQKVNGQTITWVITNIAANGNATITIKVQANAIGVKNNTLTIKTPKGTNMSVDIPVNVKPIVDVSVTKSSDKDEYFLDDIAVWTITVSNAVNGTNATNVVLEDLLPSEFEFVNYTATKGEYDSDKGLWTIGFMENGTSYTLTITSLPKMIAGKVTNIANVSCDEDEWDYTNNIANKTVEIVDTPDPRKTVNNTTPFYKEEVVYNLTIKNTGNYTYTNNLTVIDSLPEGLEFIETVGITGAKMMGEVVNGQVITWNITGIAAKSNAIIKVRVRANAVGNLTNNLTILGPHGTNKTVNCTITPRRWADLAVTKTNDHLGIDCHNSTTVIWTIKVVNNGPNDAVNAIAVDILPNGLIYISDDSNGAYDPETSVWTIGDLAKGDSVTLKIETLVDARDTYINNPVVVSSDTYDPDKSNNRANSTIKVISVADLKLTKDANVTNTTVGEKFSYNITVINDGPDTAINARVYDVLPKGLKLLSFEASKGEYNPKNGTWTIGDMEYGEEVTLEIHVKALIAGKIINEARVESDTYDNDTSNNNDSATVVVKEDHIPDIPMLPTGNPLVIALLALIAIVGTTLRRKN